MIKDDDDRDTCTIIHEGLWEIGRFAIAREKDPVDGLNHLIEHFKTVVDELSRFTAAPTMH